MSNFKAIRTELGRTGTGEDPESGGLRRVGPFVVVALLIVAAVAGVAEIHLLPTYSADDVASVLFGAG